MKTHRQSLIETAVADSELPVEFSRLLLDAAPWLDGTREVSEEFGPELLSEEALAFNVSRGKVREFFERYNTLVQSSSDPYAQSQGEAYLTIQQVLEPFGRADAFGDGDYWLVRDSFSTRTPVVQVFDEFRFSAAALAQLQRLVEMYQGIFSELRVNTEYGAEVVTLRPR